MTTTVPAAPTTPDSHELPRWRSVLAVVAHPDDEYFGLGGVLDAFHRRGSAVDVLCLTEHIGSEDGGAAGSARYDDDLSAAAEVLGVRTTCVTRHPTRALSTIPRHLLANDIIDVLGRLHVDGLLVFDSNGVTGHPEHVAATSAAVLAATVLDLPVLAWTLPAAVAERLNEEAGVEFTGVEPSAVDIVVEVDRAPQRLACEALATRSEQYTALWRRRIDLLGDSEHLRWLRRAAPAKPPVSASAADPERPRLHVVSHGGDRFEIQVRGHRILVDQPESLGGEDMAPTPTELFVASLTSCVAFYARRYLVRHKLPTDGFIVDAEYTMGKRPSRVSDVTIRVRLPEDFPPERRDGLLAVATHCTVHNSLTEAPNVAIDLE